MNRRQFTAALAGLAAIPGTLETTLARPAGSGTWLEAIVAPRTPQWLRVGIEIADRDTRVFELRVYESPQVDLAGVFRRFGIHPMLHSTGRYLIPFDSLEARHEAWATLNGTAEWKRVQNRAGRLSEVSIYRRYPGGRILEMSL